MNKNILRFLLFSLYITASLLGGNPKEEKILICGVGRNIQLAIKNMILNIENLGHNFLDYAVIIYENNSKDNSASLLKEWANRNPHVHLTSEMLSLDELPKRCTEKIARARNFVLSVARNEQFHDYPYLIMVDLDFMTPWPIDEILKTIQSPKEWDCVSANGIDKEGLYYDRYAFRDKNFPLGPELIGKHFWKDLKETWFKLSGDHWIPVFSAFGGLAIYKTSSFINFSYSGTVTQDLQEAYKSIFSTILPSNSQLKKYLSMNKIKMKDTSSIPIIFTENKFKDPPIHDGEITCCEHLTLHSSMLINGFNKIFINPKMLMHY